jgi:hypothetical protein
MVADFCPPCNSWYGLGVGLQLFTGTVPAAFAPTKPLQLAGDALSLLWLITTTGMTSAEIEFYLEFTDGNPNDPSADWFREVDEVDSGNGTVAMAAVIRTFQVNGGGNLPAGVYKLSTQFTRRAQFARIQLRIAAGAATATITAPFGSSPVG